MIYDRYQTEQNLANELVDSWMLPGVPATLHVPYYVRIKMALSYLIYYLIT